jgi:iron complex outermembrane receptor protein
MTMRVWQGSALAFCLIASPALRAEDPQAKPEAARDNTFKLGETLVVSAKLDPIETVNTKVDAEQIQEFDRDTVATALNLLPGVNLTTAGARNEQTILVRGNDSRQVPVFLDGIPVYVPYDGVIDYSRFTTFDLAEIQVEKGFSSVAFGPNTLGGAINLVSRRPAEALEGDLRLGVFEGNGKKAALNLGSNQGRWYFQAGASQAEADYTKVSSHLTPSSRQGADRRVNSYSKDRKASFKIGLTPNEKDEYAIGVVRQLGEKGNPVSTDPGVTARYWRWPQWDKTSVYFVSSTGLGEASYVRLRAYYDTYKNTLANYTDGTYSTLFVRAGSWPTGKSFYNDFTHGVMVEGGTELVPRHSLKAVLQTKTDVHREGDGSQADTANWLNYEDQMLTAGVEDSISLSDAFDLSLGAGWDRMKPVHSGPTWSLPNTQSKFHGQAGLFWKLRPKVQAYFTIAQKDRFPTLKDRYSSKFATHIPNPDLKAETSTNYEAGVKASRGEWLQTEAAVFLSDIRDLIQDTDTGTPLGGGQRGDWMQQRNIGKVRHSGLELSLGLKPLAWLQAGMGYTYLDRANRSNPSVPLMYTPRNRATAFLKLMPTASVYFLASMQAQDAQWDNASTYTTRLGGFTTYDATVGWAPSASLSLDAGFTNLFDRNYQLSTGYPMPGRTGFVNARYHF